MEGQIWGERSSGLTWIGSVELERRSRSEPYTVYLKQGFVSRIVEEGLGKSKFSLWIDLWSLSAELMMTYCTFDHWEEVIDLWMIEESSLSCILELCSTKSKDVCCLCLELTDHPQIR